MMKKGVDYPGVTIVFFCHDGTGQFLLAQRSEQCRDEHGRWDVGSGGLEFGVSVDETLQREIAEEYRTTIIHVEFLGYRDVHRLHEGHKTHWIALDFKVRVDPSTVRIGEPHKFTNIGWFHLDRLPSPLHSQLPAALQRYGDALRNHTLPHR